MFFFPAAANAFFEEEDKRADRRRQNAAMFAQFKQQNPNATMQDYEMFISSMVGGEPGLRRFLPGQQDLQRMADENRRRAEEQKKREDMEWGYRNLQMEQAAESELVTSLLNNETPQKAIQRVRESMPFLGEDGFQRILGRLGGSPEAIQDYVVNDWVARNQQQVLMQAQAGVPLTDLALPPAVARQSQRFFSGIYNRIEEERRRAEQERAAARAREDQNRAYQLATQLIPVVSSVAANTNSVEEFNAKVDEVAGRAFNLAGVQFTPDARELIVGISMPAAADLRRKSALERNSALTGPLQENFRTRVEAQSKISAESAKINEGNAQAANFARAIQAANLNGYLIDEQAAREVVANDPEAAAYLEAGDFSSLSNVLAARAGMDSNTYINANGGGQQLMPLDTYIQNRFRQAESSIEAARGILSSSNSERNPQLRLGSLRQLRQQIIDAKASNTAALSRDDILKNVAEPGFAIDFNSVAARVEPVRQANGQKLDALLQDIEQSIRVTEAELNAAEKAKEAARQSIRDRTAPGSNMIGFGGI